MNAVLEGVGVGVVGLGGVVAGFQAALNAPKPKVDDVGDLLIASYGSMFVGATWGYLSNGNVAGEAAAAAVGGFGLGAWMGLAFTGSFDARNGARG